MKDKCRNLFHGEEIVNFSSSILAIICGLLFGLIILLPAIPDRLFMGS